MRATQALLVATERGDAEAVRQLALYGGAELAGARALNKRGCGPIGVLADSLHLTHKEQQRVLKELAELPLLLGAKEAAIAAGQRGGSDAAARELRASSKASRTAADDDAVTIASAAVVTLLPEACLASTLKGKEMRTQLALSRLAASVRPHAHGSVCDAALADPRLLRAPLQTAERALPTLAHVLKSEELAVRAVARNPRLLHHEAMTFKKVVPALAATLGSEAEAAYAVSVRPDLLGIERPQVMRDAVQVVSNCLGSMKDAVWLAVQSIAPPTLRVTARSWSHEAIVGEYMRVEGTQVGDRPVYLKPAPSMAHLGSKALDVYVLFNDIEGCWTFASSMEAYKKRRSGLTGVADAVGLGRAAPSACFTPDHAPADGWAFRNMETGVWAADPYVRVADGGQQRGPTILTATPQQLRHCLDMLREVLGLYWRKAGDGGSPGGDARFLGSPQSGDNTHLAGGLGGGCFEDIGAFTMGKGYSFVQLGLTLASQPTLELVMWEPIAIYLLYCGAKAPADDAAPGGGDQSAGMAWVEPVQASGFHVGPESLTLPTLKGIPAVEHIFVRCCPRGEHAIPVPAGPGGLPPLVFIRSQVSAEGRGGIPCEVIKALSGSQVCFGPTGGFPGGSTGDGGGVMAEAVPAAPAVPRLANAGELGYNGFLCFRPDANDLACEPSETLLRIDTGAQLNVVVAWFQVPPAGGEGEVQEAAEDGASGARRRSLALSSRSPPAVAQEWAQAGGWSPYESRIPVALFPAHSEKAVVALGLVARDMQPGQLSIPGAGAGVTTLVFFRRVGEARPDETRALLLRQPSLLAAGDKLAMLLRRMRVELGDERARRLLVDKGSGWEKVCQSGSAADLEAWVFARKVEALAGEVRNSSRAKAIMKQNRSVAAVAAPELLERCRAMQQALGSNAALLDVLGREPQLLAHEASAFAAASAALAAALDPAAAQRLLRQQPKLLLLDGKVRMLLDTLLARFPDVARTRFQDFTFAPLGSSEWTPWPDMVEAPPAELAAWLGRVGSEERSGSCRERVRTFGATPSPEAQ